MLLLYVVEKIGEMQEACEHVRRSGGTGLLSQISEIFMSISKFLKFRAVLEATTNQILI
jgi:hypothetical protein